MNLSFPVTEFSPTFIIVVFDHKSGLLYQCVYCIHISHKEMCISVHTYSFRSKSTVLMLVYLNLLLLGQKEEPMLSCRKVKNLSSIKCRAPICYTSNIQSICRLRTMFLEEKAIFLDIILKNQQDRDSDIHLGDI